MKLLRPLFLVPLVFLTLIIYFFRPWIHSIALSLYVNPFIIQSVIIAALVGYYLFSKTTNEEKPMKTASNVRTITLVFISFIVIGGIANTAYTNVSMAEDLESNVTEINSLPDIDNENPRILPKTVAEEFAENSLQEPRHRLAESDIAINDNGTPKWSFPLQPDGGLNKYIIKQKGLALADMTTSSSNVSYSSGEMDVGIGMQIFDNINWQQKKQRFWINYEDHFVLEHEGENYIATPYIEYDYRFKFPVIYTVPEWGGVALTDSKGQIEYVDKNDIEENKVLKDQRSYPYELSRDYVSSMEYGEGIINKWFLHENQLEVAKVPGFDNDQPFMILTEDNPELFVATEPYGQASGLFEIWTIDAVTGQYEVYRLNRDEGLIGANRAVNFVRQANSRVNWADRDSDTGFSPIEPLPVIVDDKLYWQVRVVPLDSAGIAFTSFVDAETSNVYTAREDDEIIKFLKGDDIEQNLETNQTQETKEGEIEITIIEEGKEVETITTDSKNFDIQVREK